MTDFFSFEDFSEQGVKSGCTELMKGLGTFIYLPNCTGGQGNLLLLVSCHFRQTK